MRVARRLVANLAGRRWAGRAAGAWLMFGLCAGSVDAATISNNPTLIQGTVTLTINVTLLGGFTPSTGSCVLTLTSSDPHAGVASASVNASINASQVSCAPVANYYFMVNDKSGTVTISYSVALYDPSGQFRSAVSNSYLLSASSTNLSPSMTLNIQM